jgi:tyramine---L-glutamate ligase
MKAQTPQLGNGLRVIVYEYVSGGGYADQSLPSDVLAEAFGMLRCFVADLKTAGHEVTVLLDDRLSKLNPPLDADFILPVMGADEPKRFISEIAKINDAIYVIAPETDRILQKMVEFTEGIGKISLNCKSNAIEKVSDKAALYENLEDKGFLIPQSLIREIDENTEELLSAIDSELSYPVVFKPVDGASCSGISLVTNKKSIQVALEKIIKYSTDKRFIIQEYVAGEAASVSVLSNGKKAQMISVNRQSITLAEPNSQSNYVGGCVPFNHQRWEDAGVLAEKVVESISGLRGYVGVDVILTQEDIFIVDVNPRLTTSYVGLRQVADFNVAATVLDSVVNGKLPRAVKNNGIACFSKIKTNCPQTPAFEQAAKLSDVISPPFPLENNANSCALILGNGNSLSEAQRRLEEAKKNLLNIVT